MRNLKSLTLTLSTILVMVYFGLGAIANEINIHNKYQRAEIYFVGWEVTTRIRLSIDNVREIKKIVIQINDPAYVSKFVEWLRLDEMKDVKYQSEEDKRLVIDLVRFDGTVDVYYANKHALFSSDSARMREIDDDFLVRFEIIKPRP